MSNPRSSSYIPTGVGSNNNVTPSNPMSIPTVSRVLGFHPSTVHQHTSPIPIARPSTSSGIHRIEGFQPATAPSQPIKPRHTFAPPAIGNGHTNGSTTAHLTPPPTAATVATHTSPLPLNGPNSSASPAGAPSSSPFSSSSSSASSSASELHQQSSRMIISPPPSHHSSSSVAAVSSTSFTLAPIPSSSNTPLAHSMPVSLPAFRRAISFVGLDQGFDLVAPELDNIGRINNKTNHANNNPSSSSSATAAGGVAPKIQNYSALGQQLRHHFSSGGTARPLTKAASNVNMADADAEGDVVDGDGDSLPEISSPPPTGALQFSFDSGDVDDRDNSSSSTPGGPRLNFDDVHINSRDQVLGAIPQVIVPTQNDTQPPQPIPSSTTRILSTRWTPLSSSAPSQLTSSIPFRARRDSSGSTTSSVNRPISFAGSHRRSDDVHTPTTIASDHDGAVGVVDDLVVDDHVGSDVDSVGDAEVDHHVDPLVHGDGSSCSLTSCSSCSGESSDFSVNLEDDFDTHVSLTFHRPDEDQIGLALKSRLNQARRDHHIERHIHHRRRKVRRALKQQRDEARALQLAEAAEPAPAPINEDDLITVGSYTHGERQGKIQRYLEKRRRRVWSKKILYSCRKSFADKRPRIGGRFVKLKEDDPNATLMMMMAGRESFSLSTSPAGGGIGMASGIHTPNGMLAFAQHMHGIARGGHGQMTAFSLPMSSYAHTTFSPSSASPSERNSFSLQAPVFGFAGGSSGGASSSAAHHAGGTTVGEGSLALSFFKDNNIPTMTHTHASGIAAALAPGGNITNGNNTQVQQ